MQTRSAEWSVEHNFAEFSSHAKQNISNKPNDFHLPSSLAKKEGKYETINPIKRLASQWFVCSSISNGDSLFFVYVSVPLKNV